MVEKSDNMSSHFDTDEWHGTKIAVAYTALVQCHTVKNYYTGAMYNHV